MIGQVAHIVRHPIKSLGWEELPAVDLTTGKTLPYDRHWALAHSAATFDDTPEGWHPKRNFVRGVASAPLMAIRAVLSADNRHVTLAHPERPALEIAPDSDAATPALTEWVAPLWPSNRPEPARLVTAGTCAMTDVPDPFVSILNLASLRDLGRRMGRDLSIHRFRGNLWLDGPAPWDETGWIGRDLSIGPVRLRIVEPITRCKATCADPDTGRADGDTLGALQSAFGHQDFGLYATVVDGGHLGVGDAVGIGR